MKDSYRQCSNRTADGSFSIPTALFKTLSADKTGLKDEKDIGQATSRKLHCDFERFKNSG